MLGFNCWHHVPDRNSTAIICVYFIVFKVGGKSLEDVLQQMYSLFCAYAFFNNMKTQDFIKEQNQNAT